MSTITFIKAIKNLVKIFFFVTSSTSIVSIFQLKQINICYQFLLIFRLIYQLQIFVQLITTNSYYVISNHSIYPMNTTIYNYKLLVCNYGNACHGKHQWNSKKGNPDRGRSLLKPHMLYRVTIC